MHPRTKHKILRTLSSLELLGLAGTANTARESAERDDLLVVGYVAKVGVCLRELEACTRIEPTLSVPRSRVQPTSLTRQGSRDLAHVLEVRPEVFTPGAGSCKRTGYTVSLPHKLDMSLRSLDALFSGLVARAAAA